jgi:hypothetical protein
MTAVTINNTLPITTTTTAITTTIATIPEGRSMDVARMPYAEVVSQ